MIRAVREQVIAALSVCLVQTACGSAGGVRVEASPSPSVSPSTSVIMGKNVPQHLEWAGAASGGLSSANTRCSLANPLGVGIYAGDGTVLLNIPFSSPIAPGIRSVGSADDISIYLARGPGGGVYFSRSGTVSIDLGGVSGGIDVQMAQQQGSPPHLPEQPSLHLTGDWHCR